MHCLPSCCWRTKPSSRMRSYKGEHRPCTPKTPIPDLFPPLSPHCSLLYSVPDDYRCGKALGPVESIQEHPQDAGRLLIGYSRGLVALWDQSTRTVQHLFLGNQVPGPGWLLYGGEGFHPASSLGPKSPLSPFHSSWRAWPGSTAGRTSSAHTVMAATWCGQWAAAGSAPSSPSWPPSPTVGGHLPPKPSRGARGGPAFGITLGFECYKCGVTFVSGPFPCKAISKILWRTCESG